MGVQPVWGGEEWGAEEWGASIQPAGTAAPCTVWSAASASSHRPRHRNKMSKMRANIFCGQELTE